MIWLVLLWQLFLPTLGAAVALPQPSDVVLWYEDGDVEAQTKYDYLFTVAGDDTIYPCAANRCSLEPFLEQGTVDLTIYKLPEGYPRVANIVDQDTLVEYRNAAEQTYKIAGVSTMPTNTDEEADSTGRTFQEIHLKADGSFESSTVTQERNSQLITDEATTTGWPRWLWPVVGLIGLVGVVGVGVWLWKRKF